MSTQRLLIDAAWLLQDQLQSLARRVPRAALVVRGLRAIDEKRGPGASISLGYVTHPPWAGAGPAPRPWSPGSEDQGSWVFCSLSAEPGGKAAHCWVTVVGLEDKWQVRQQPHCSWDDMGRQRPGPADQLRGWWRGCTHPEGWATMRPSLDHLPLGLTHLCQVAEAVWRVGAPSQRRLAAVHSAPGARASVLISGNLTEPTAVPPLVGGCPLLA